MTRPPERAPRRAGHAPEPRYPYVVVQVPDADTDETSVRLFDLGAYGVEVRDATTLERGGALGVTLVGHFTDHAQARRGLRALRAAGLEAELGEVVGDAWRDAWKQHFVPRRFGRRLVVRPSWEPFDAGPGDAVVVLDPGRAFGSGLHASTGLVLGELDRRIRGGERVLDVGCGSGILALAALALGASRAVAVDNDPEAVEVTLENARANDAGRRLSARLPPLPRTTRGFDVVLANIQADVLVALAPALARRVAPGGLLVLSGILSEQADEVKRAFGGLRTLARPSADGWTALVLKRPADPAKAPRARPARHR